MIVWQGWGITAPLIFTVSLYFVLFVFEREDDSLIQTTNWIWAITCFLGGAVSYSFGKKWRQTPGKLLIDKTTGKKVELKTKHTFLWIDLVYWGYLYGILGIIATISVFF
jgi:hypothetical protein